MKIKLSDIKEKSQPHKKQGFAHPDDEKFFKNRTLFPLTLPQTHMLYLMNRSDYCKGRVDDELFNFLGQFKKHVFFIFGAPAMKHFSLTITFDGSVVSDVDLNNDSDLVLQNICFKKITQKDFENIKEYLTKKTLTYHRINHYLTEDFEELEPFFLQLDDEFMYQDRNRKNLVIYYNTDEQEKLRDINRTTRRGKIKLPRW